MRINSHLLPVLFAAIVVIAACSDSTRPRLQSPLVGQWELTTHFDAFSFETGWAEGMPDCDYLSLYCFHSGPSTAGGFIAGTLEFRDTTSSPDSVAKSVVANGTLRGSFCDAFDTATFTGCVHVGEPTAYEYSGSVDGVPDDALGKSLSVRLEKPGDYYGMQQPVIMSSDATFAGDSIYGTIRWGIVGRSPPTFHGTFVLRRVH